MKRHFGEVNGWDLRSLLPGQDGVLYYGTCLEPNPGTGVDLEKVGCSRWLCAFDNAHPVTIELALLLFADERGSRAQCGPALDRWRAAQAGGPDVGMQSGGPMAPYRQGDSHEDGVANCSESSTPRRKKRNMPRVMCSEDVSPALPGSVHGESVPEVVDEVL